MKVAVSFLSSNYDLEKTIKMINATDADYLHVDVMDGEFVSNQTTELTKILEMSNKKLDVHLMVSEPMKYVYYYKKMNATYLTFHYEAVEDVMEVINFIKSSGMRVGISLKPETSIEKIIRYLPYLDQVLIMSVNPGQGGQKFMPEVITKIDELKAMQKNYHYIINVDGGINNETISQVHSDMVVAGSYICKSDEMQARINCLRKG